MKKALLSFLCILLAVVLLLSATAVAAEAEAELPSDIYAVVSLTDGGEIVVDEAPDADLMQESESYELYVGDEPVLSVEHLLSGVGEAVQAPQFYSVDFTIPDTQYGVFLTGLREDDVAEIQQRIIENYAAGQSFELTDFGFIDAEKTYNSDGDDELCWAASASDMLVYTGWAAQAGFESEDDVFEAFIDAYENGGGHQFYAFSWFFNGAASNDNSGSYGARILDYPNTGRYLNDYAFDRYTNEHSFTVSDMDTVAARLREGDAVGLGVYIFSDNSSDVGGHAVTMWGYVVDSAKASGDPDRYLSIFLTDSDSDELMDADRRDAHNVMSVYPIEAYNGYYYFSFDEHTDAQIYDYITLAPYSAELTYETDPDATKDKVTRPDLAISEMYLSDSDSVREQKTLLESGSTASFSFKVSNYGDKGYSGYLYPQVTLTSDDGTVVFEDNSRVYNMSNGISIGGYVTIPDFSASDLAAGDYTLSFRINPDHSANRAAPEAFYYNNTNTLTFRVRDSYLLGDYDGNGEINILDATKLQRTLAGFSMDLDENAPERGDVNGGGLSIIDVTVIQRYLADLTVTAAVGEKQLYS